MSSALLVDASTLASSLGQALVLDVRWRLGGPPGIDSYRAGHVPGAVFVDLDHDLSGPPGAGGAPGAPGAGGRHPLPSAAAFQASMRSLGVRAGSAVVVYDDGDSMPASRAWWALRYFGHHNVRVLDGGFRAWTAMDLPVEVTSPVVAPVVAPGDFVARPGGMPLADAAGAASLARDGVLLDVRTPERYRGETEPIDPVAGHIPGAVNAPIAETANADGTFRDASALAATFATQGVTPSATGLPSATVGVYCGSGVTAARGVLALALAGIPAALYVGSWSDWITDPTRPIAP